MKRYIVFEVAPVGGPDWELKGPTGAPLLRASNKKEILKAAERIAREQAPSQLLVRGRDGELLDELTYGADFFPPSL